MPMDITQAYQQMVGFNIPNPMQRQVWDYIHNNQTWGVGLLLKAPTGSGKTEAVSIPVLAGDELNKRRLIMVYPTRSLVDDQIKRFRRMILAWSKQTKQTLTLVVDTGAQSIRYCWRNGELLPASGNMRRHLYQGDVIITTLDKFLYRFFGFGEPGKSYIYPLRIHYGAKKMLVCFDEAHTYDDIAFTNFTRLVKTMYEKGLDVVLMTATMPESLENEFNYLDKIDFTTGQNRQSLAEFTRRQFSGRQYPEKKLIYIPTSTEPQEDEPAQDDDRYYSEETVPRARGAISPAIIEIINQAKKYYAPGKRLIVTVERVKDAVEVYRQLSLTSPQGEVWLYHGRLTSDWRRAVYREISQRDDKNEGYVLISTSAIEVGCDLNVHILITQLCDPERLIQRAGRCNRKHEIADAEIIVVGATIPEWMTSFTNTKDLNNYIKELKKQHGRYLDVEALINCIRTQTNSDYRIEMMFSMLYEYVYEAKLENKPLHDKGLLFTRSWEPTITLCTGEDPKGRLLNAVEVPVSRCVGRKDDNISGEFSLQKYTFNRRDRKPEWDVVGSWECAYAIDLVAVQQESYSDFDKKIGYVDLPKLFNQSYLSGNRRVLVREDDNGTSRVWYLDKARGNIVSMLAEELLTENDAEGDTIEVDE
ncbi:MAG: CRISPR-associated helicase Cas3' [Anaerolineae bacterium]|nr:CRISPR-associated helicase Cas3' [Anaerolineae bacterium]